MQVIILIFFYVNVCKAKLVFREETQQAYDSQQDQMEFPGTCF